jgi:hypothetical protein
VSVNFHPNRLLAKIAVRVQPNPDSRELIASRPAAGGPPCCSAAAAAGAMAAMNAVFSISVAWPGRES